MMDANFDITKDNPEPLFIQTKNYILEQIKKDLYKSGEKIPPERDLCEKLNVSRYTIRKAIKELVHEGYLYRVQGDGTFVFSKSKYKQQKSSYIGVILSEFVEVQTSILRGIGLALKKSKYKLTLLQSDNDYVEEAKCIQKLKNEGVGGLIIVPVEDQKDNSAITDLSDENIPFVLADRKLNNYHTNCIVSNNVEGGYKATEHLIKLGHKNIMFLKQKYTLTSSIQERIIGFKKALSDYEIDFADKLIHPYSSDAELLSFIKDENITAVFCVHDIMALKFIEICKTQGLKIPKDLSVIGFDNQEVVKHVEPALTTVAQYPVEIGYNAAKILIDQISYDEENSVLDQDDASIMINNKNILRQYYHPVNLIIRNSTKKLKI